MVSTVLLQFLLYLPRGEDTTRTHKHNYEEVRGGVDCGGHERPP
jgi:hypothetical protein